MSDDMLILESAFFVQFEKKNSFNLTDRKVELSSSIFPLPKRYFSRYFCILRKEFKGIQTYTPKYDNIIGDASS